MKIGVVGLPNVGKSTLFNALTKNRAESANYPFCTIEPNIGIVSVPDERVDYLASHYKAKSIVHATIEFVDIAGLVKGASSGEGLGNKFLSHIREVDAILHVVRAFDNSNIIHVEGGVDPIRDINTINLELILADLETVSKRYERTWKQSKQGTFKEYLEELDLLKKIQAVLEDEKMANSIAFTEKERVIVKTFCLLTTKPVIYCVNLNEAEELEQNKHCKNIKELATTQGNSVIGISAKIEEEIGQIDDGGERDEIMQMYNLSTSGLDRLIVAAYKLLGLISFLTAGEQEVRAWTIQNGTRAPQAAGRIHTDFERGFIRAEVFSFDDFKTQGNIDGVRKAGKLRSEGKDYIVKDGDVVLFRFNV